MIVFFLCHSGQLCCWSSWYQSSGSSSVDFPTQNPTEVFWAGADKLGVLLYSRQADRQVEAQLKTLGSRHVRYKTVQTVNAIWSSAHITNFQGMCKLLWSFEACAAFRLDLYSRYFIDQQLSARQSSYDFIMSVVAYLIYELWQAIVALWPMHCTVIGCTIEHVVVRLIFQKA